MDGFTLWRMDPLERGHNIVEGLARTVLCQTLHHALRWDDHLLESQSDLKLRFLAGTDYEMPELVSDDLVMGSRLCLWSPTFALHVLLNSGVEAILMCLNSLRLPNHVRTPHIVDSDRAVVQRRGNDNYSSSDKVHYRGREVYAKWFCSINRLMYSSNAIETLETVVPTLYSASTQHRANHLRALARLLSTLG
ncbi:hypothetical protein M9H77_12525 [Catharanthus roseus]|uniref:Uncharacterized protein n=1 Tax=Catharanthus roseus TaxID=4058 RepID=A0ACC0BHR9_CATRO|nr:hypothetical protein M9H77_12525 [Catharanthus roseus]